MKRGLKGGISIDADSGPLGYVLFAVVVEVEKHILFFRLAMAYCECMLVCRQQVLRSYCPDIHNVEEGLRKKESTT